MAFGPQEAMAFLVDELGYPPHVAAGIAGNIQSESGFDPGVNERDPVVKGSRGGFGLYQLTGPRRTAYEGLADSLGVDRADPYAQLSYLDRELNTTERKARDKLFATETVDDAARVFSSDFLRPGIPHLERRIANARAMAGLGEGEGDVGLIDRWEARRLKEQDEEDESRFEGKFGRMLGLNEGGARDKLLGRIGLSDRGAGTIGSALSNYGLGLIGGRY